MPSNWMSIDNNFPSFTGQETPQQQIAALHNYLFQLREGLQYSLRNLTVENFNATALQNLTDAQKTEITEQLQQVYNLLNGLSSEVSRLSSRVTGIENLSGRVTSVETEVIFLGKDTADLQQRMIRAETDLADHVGRIGVTETDILELKSRAEDLAVIEDEVYGEGGLREQAEQNIEQIRTLMGAVQVADDGSATFGSAGKTLHLVGEIYINGVLYEGGT